MNFDIHYVMEYRYSAAVTDNLNTLKVRPANTASQHCDDFQLRVDPAPRITRRTDYFGTDVLEFGITTPHQRLSIDVRTRVSTTEPPAPLEDGTWAMLRGDAYQDACPEFVLPSADDPSDELLGDLVDAVRAETPLATATGVHEVIFDRFEYRPGATYVGSTIADLLAAGGGVCQDFAHLSLALLRRHGLAARYVSGYLFSTSDESGAQAVAAGVSSVEVQTHAWVEVLLPGGDGGEHPHWVGVDPTNRQLVDSAYVKIGHGRDYSDVAPTRGVYFGAAVADLSAHVTMTRLDPARI